MGGDCSRNGRKGKCIQDFAGNVLKKVNTWKTYALMGGGGYGLNLVS